jgi:hypothetical protein
MILYLPMCLLLPSGDLDAVFFAVCQRRVYIFRLALHHRWDSGSRMAALLCFSCCTIVRIQNRENCLLLLTRPNFQKLIRYQFCLDNQWITRSWAQRVAMPTNVPPATREPYEPNEVARVAAPRALGVAESSVAAVRSR